MRKNPSRTADLLRDTAQHPFHIEIIEFEAEDVITTSGCNLNNGFDVNGGEEP